MANVMGMMEVQAKAGHHKTAARAPGSLKKGRCQHRTHTPQNSRSILVVRVDDGIRTRNHWFHRPAL